MEFKDLLTTVAQTVKAHSPEILTALGVSGMLSTVYLTGKASFKAARIIDQVESEQTEPEQVPPTPRELLADRTKLVWKLYIPAAASGVFTLGCFAASLKVSGAKTTAAITAYSLTERAFSEYREKVVEELGKGKQRKVVDQIAQDRVTANPEGSKEVIIIGGKHVLCCELYTGRYFRSDMETLRRAENDINAMINGQRYVALDDLYELIGLASTSVSSNLGWDSDRLLDFTYSTVISPQGEPCIAFDYNYVKPLT
jgi:Family of unknown function (DUF6353)